MNHWLMKKESLKLLNDGGQLIYYKHKGIAKIEHNDQEYLVDGRSYHSLLRDGFKPLIINDECAGY